MFLNRAMLPPGVHTTPPFPNCQRGGRLLQMLDRSCPAESAQPPRAGTGVTQSHTILRRTRGICGKHPSKPLPGLPRAWRPCGRNAGAATLYLQSCPHPTWALRSDPKSLLSCPCPSLSLLSSVSFTCVPRAPGPCPFSSRPRSPLLAPSFSRDLPFPTQAPRPLLSGSSPAARLRIFSKIPM